MSDPLIVQTTDETGTVTETPLVVTQVDAPDPNPPAAEPEARGDTEYVILRAHVGLKTDLSSGDLWEAVKGTVKARTPKAAVEAYAETLPDFGGADKIKAQAIAARNWKPLSVGTEVVTTRTLVIEDA